MLSNSAILPSPDASAGDAAPHGAAELAPTPEQVREEMLYCLREASTEADTAVQGYLEAVFHRVGAAYAAPDAEGLERVLSVLRADAFRLGRSVELIQANGARLHRLLEQAAQRTTPNR